MSPHPDEAVTRRWNGRLLDAGLRQHDTGSETGPRAGAGAGMHAGAESRTDTDAGAGAGAGAGPGTVTAADSPPIQSSCPPEDVR
ncbi:hypothetical protein K353_01083 [Kitasatospora sp. SolWspMP-SS2h]|uniref:hypothetical protein n=1 Tax=Kitasatospora sp. SolWspMP-SS2h TaxID=1305729 RepID=UPI000DB96616|nr:hypothetical protein [Kitasatospora sp. SolWspMP-SS2h]RAJ45583.1 hypothetical protein K353_01083 [Kitasatospora sp. SolWspMP-SS2h]